MDAPATTRVWLGDPVPDDLASVPQRINHILQRWVTEQPHAPALVDQGAVVSYRELSLLIAHTRARMVAWGIRPGDRVLLVNENSVALVAMIFAASELDAWPVIVNARLSAREIDQIARHSGSRRTFFTVAASTQAQEHADRLGATIDRLDDAPWGRIAVGPLVEDAEPEPVEIEGKNQVGALIYTTGTTGDPKGVMLTHHNLLYVACVSGGLRVLSPADRVLGVLPISHVFGLASVFLGSLLHGSALYLMPRFDSGAVIKLLEQDGLTVLQGVPAMFQRFLEHLAVHKLATVPHPHLRFLSAGGSSLDPAVKQAVEDLFGLPLNNGYGLTEYSPTISQTRLDGPRTDCTVGPLLPGTSAKLVALDGSPVAPDGIGELWVTGPGVMKGYYRSPEATAQTVEHGWLKTGDLAHFEHGNLYIDGRAKELIIRSGFNVYPPEVEAVLNAHPAVTQSAVIGRVVPGNEEVIAFVQAIPGMRVTREELAAFAAEHLAPYKRPSEIVLLDALPASSTGKILKARLRDLATADG